MAVAVAEAVAVFPLYDINIGCQTKKFKRLP